MDVSRELFFKDVARQQTKINLRALVAARHETDNFNQEAALGARPNRACRKRSLEGMSVPVMGRE
jgi:hypothetical protein